MASKEQRKEAVLRLEQLTKKFQLNPNLVKYLKEGKVYYSYIVSGMLGCVDTITYDETYVKIVSEFEKMYDCYVYHAIESYSIFGKMLSLLYVGDEDEWEEERLSDIYIMSYVYNIDNKFGEFGDIILGSDNGALVRTDLGNQFNRTVIHLNNL